MKVTIGIPPHGRITYLDEVFKSALSQRYGDYEIIVGDSSPDDSVYKKVRSLGSQGRIRYIRYPHATSQPQKFNEMLKEARGEWMAFLGDDDSFDPDFLKVMMAHAEEVRRATILLCRFRVINSRGKLLRVDPLNKAVMSPSEFLSRLFLPAKEFFTMNITGPLFRRDILLEEGGFELLSHHWHTDIIGWAKVGSRGSAIFEERPLCSIRVHSHSETSSFQDNLDALIQTSQDFEKIMTSVLTKVESEITDEQDRKFIKIAKQNLHIYASRHIGRAFDHGFLNLLSQDSQNLHGKLENLFERMRKMEIPVFLSARFYPYLAVLNYSVRQLALNALIWCKLKKQCS